MSNGNPSKDRRPSSLLGQCGKQIRCLPGREAIATAGNLVEVMVLHPIRIPIARRTLQMGAHKIAVTILLPELFGSDGEYSCSYSIEGEGISIETYAIGIDSIQAIQLAMRKAGSDLVYLSAKSGLEITWLPDSPGDTGFPT